MRYVLALLVCQHRWAECSFELINLPKLVKWVSSVAIETIRALSKANKCKLIQIAEEIICISFTLGCSSCQLCSSSKPFVSYTSLYYMQLLLFSGLGELFVLYSILCCYVLQSQGLLWGTAYFQHFSGKKPDL